MQVLSVQFWVNLGSKWPYWWGLCPNFCSAAQFCHSKESLRVFQKAQPTPRAASGLANSGIPNGGQHAEDRCKSWLRQDYDHRAATAKHAGAPKLVLGSRDAALCGIIAANHGHVLLSRETARRFFLANFGKLLLAGRKTAT